MTGVQNPVGAMFGRIAGVYDFLNHFLSLGIDRSWRKELAEMAVANRPRVSLDLACGTLDVSLAVLAACPTVLIPAIDFCPQMLAAGIKKLKTSTQKERILPLAGDALHIPVRNDLADSLTIAFGIRNIPDRPLAFQEMLRVLAPGGKACILEFGSGREKIWHGVYNFYLARILPAIGKIIARDKAAYDYLARTIAEFPAASALAQEMIDAGFSQVGYKKLTSGIVCLHWGVKKR